MQLSLNLPSSHSRKFYIRRNNNKVDSIETGRIVVARFFPWSDLEKCMNGKFVWLMMITVYRHYLICKYNFACSLFWSQQTIESFWPFQIVSFQLPSTPKLEDRSPWLIKGYSVEDFWKVISFFSYELLKSLQ